MGGFAVWVTGPEERANQAIADDVVARLRARRVPTELLDRRTAGGAEVAPEALPFLATVLGRHGVATVVALPTPKRSIRERARAELPRMIEVYVYPAEATTDPDYEPPTRPEVEVAVPEVAPGTGADRVLMTLEVLGCLARPEESGYAEQEEREVIRRLKAFGYL